MPEAPRSQPEIADRVVRVFVSSTFRDMHAERDELIKRVFSQLRRLCEERGVGFADVDLRWGVTEEEAAEGKVLPICLAEIHRCRPFFIGLLGERYGWVPQEIPDELIDQEPWLAEHREKSVTELEILHGVLNNPEMTNRATFDRLNQHADGGEDGPALVVLGESGCGKSALLANWAARYRREHPDVFLLVHFIGGTPYSADWAAMLRRILGELKRRFGIEGEIPDKPDALRAAFAM